MGESMSGEQTVPPRPRNYGVLLALLLLVLALETIATRSVGHQIFSDAFRTALAIAIWVVVFRQPRERVSMALLLVVSVAISWGRYIAPSQLDQVISLATQGTLSVFLWFTVYVILRDLFRKSAPGSENVLGAICGYLIAAYAWARVNAVAYLLIPSAYSINPDVMAMLPDWHGRVALFAYYTFAQVLTIVYADVTPIRAPATTLSLFAAMFGVFYTAVVVSQFVGFAQHRHPRPSDDSTDAAGTRFPSK
jgi:hypothetical protein